MSLEIKQLHRKDYKKAIAFAIQGMHFDIYFEGNKFLTYLYGKYFLFSEMLQATHIIAAYYQDTFVGLLIARVNGEKKKYYSFSNMLYVKIFEGIQDTFYKSSAGEYDMACKEMLQEYKKNNTPDGEIIFLAADSNAKTKGIGSRLLEEFESKQNGKIIYLYTDDQCTYQFYEHRGFTRVVEKDVVLQCKSNIDLKCMLYSKRIK